MDRGGDVTAPTRCYMQLGACGPAVAWLTTSPAGNTLRVCRDCLNWWLDNADTHADTEPTAWGWISRPEPALSDEHIAAALTDPRYRAQVSKVLQVESWRNPGWLREFMLREERGARYGNYVRAR
jgi:hypothetical protein